MQTNKTTLYFPYSALILTVALLYSFSSYSNFRIIGAEHSWEDCCTDAHMHHSSVWHCIYSSWSHPCENELLHCCTQTHSYRTVTACMGTFKLKYKLATQNHMNVHQTVYTIFSQDISMCTNWATSVLALGGNGFLPVQWQSSVSVSYTHLRAHETLRYLVCRLLLE